jgi:glutamyl-tRNA reductase
MELVCLGVNHKTAPVEVRERFAVGTTKLGEAAQHLLEMAGAPEGVVVSTCNRTEFYLVAENASVALTNLQHSLAEKVHGHEEPFYHYQQRDAARHLCKVVSGLDSMLLGETEIFGQVKQAYQAAHEAGATGSILNRTQTSIQEGSTSIGNVAVELAEKIFGHLKDSEVMVLGAGEMSRLTAQALVSRGAKSIIVANRTHDRAVELADEMGGRAVRFDEWLVELKNVDVVISSTGAPHTIIHRDEVESLRRARKYRPLFMIDIAVPRDIEHSVGEIEEVYLYDIDALEQLAEEAKVRRVNQIVECEKIIEEELEKLGLTFTSSQ